MISSFLTGIVALFGGDAFIMWLLLSVMCADFLLGVHRRRPPQAYPVPGDGAGCAQFVYYVSYIGLVGV